MGQTQSEAAEARAARGFPGFVSEAELGRLMHRCRVQRSLLGRRVRLLDGGEGGGGGCVVEYVRLRTPAAAGAGGMLFYQRVDGSGDPPKFPRALAPTELAEPGGAPYELEMRGDNCAAELVDPQTGQRGIYRRGGGGIWVKVQERR